jgi:hypothetical protein
MPSHSISVFPIESRPYGLTYGEWSARWWQWLLSIQRSKSPVFDSEGYNANENQRDPNVFFLCQTIDSIKAAKPTQNRRITVKAGRSILIPIINWISVLYIDGQTDEELVSVAKKRMDVVSALEITIDGVTVNEGLERYRARSPFFDMMISEDNIFELPPGAGHFVSDGYWIFLEPLQKNTRLSTFGSCSSGLNRFGINYDITLI